MTQQPNPAAPANVSSALNHLPWCGPLSLLRGENTADYDDLFARMSGFVKPTDLIEEIWVHDIVDLIWENLRWRRARTRLLEAALPRVLEEVLKPFWQDHMHAANRPKSFQGKIDAAVEEITAEGLHKLVRRWVQREPEAIKLVDQLLASANLSIDQVMAQVIVRELANVERFNRLIANTEWRRNAVLHEIDRHRTSLAAKLRSEIDKVEDAEFSTIDAKPVDAKPVDAKPVDAKEANPIEAKPVDANPLSSEGEVEPAVISRVEMGPAEAQCVPSKPTSPVTIAAKEASATNIGLALNGRRVS